MPTSSDRSSAGLGPALRTVRLLAFGYPRILDAEGVAIAVSDKAMIAICHLATSEGKRRSRVELARFLWSECDMAHALVNFRKMLSRFKARQQELGVEFLRIDGEIVQLDERVFSSDACEMLDRMGSGEPSDIGRIDALYRGDFLAGYDAEGEAIQAWLDAHRARFAAYVIDALRRELTAAEAAGEFVCVKQAAFRVLEFNAHDEPAYRALIEACVRLGQHDEARALFERCRRRLWADLHVAPEAQTVELGRRLLRQVPFASGKAGPEAAPSAQGSGIPRLVLLLPADEIAAAMLEDVTIGLCSLRTLGIVAPHSARQMPGNGAASDALRSYSIDYALDTRVSRRGDTSALFVQLIRFDRQEVVWAERYDLSPQELAGNYRHTTLHLVQAIAGEVGRQELARCKLDRQPGAYHHFLLGQQHLRHIDLRDIRRARNSFRAALQEMRQFSPALSGIARTYHLEWLLTARGDATLLHDAEAFARKAIAADYNNAGGHHELGVTKLFLGEFDESVLAFETAELAGPQNADVIAGFGDTLIHAAHPAEGLRRIDAAIELNPLCPDVYWWSAAGGNFQMERYDAALTCLARMKDRLPASRLAAACHAMLGEAKAASRHMRRAKAIHPDFDIDNWLSIVPFKEEWQRSHYRDGLRKAGF